jgi:hypothetical protein
MACSVALTQSFGVSKTAFKVGKLKYLSRHKVLHLGGWLFMDSVRRSASESSLSNFIEALSIKTVETRNRCKQPVFERVCSPVPIGG